jgi:type IX secretion system PorP/SprF family membrane protein
MKHIYSYLLLILTFCCLAPAKAQQRPVITQYMFNGLVLNPAFAGSHQQISASALFRDQWLNFNGAPRFSNFSIHSGLEKRKIGLGFMTYLDQIGIHSDLGMYAMYSYKIKMRTGVLSMGLQGGLNYREADWNKLNNFHDNDPLMQGRSVQYNPNFGTGVYYYTKTYYVGLSVPYLVNNRFVMEDGTSYGKESRNYYLTAGKLIDLNEKVKLKPSTLIRFQEDSPISIDLNTNLILDDLVSFGVSYRSGESIAGLFEMKLSKNLRMGYAYDWVLSSLRAHTQGSHEFMLNYRFDFTGISSRIPCPSFLY